MAASDRLYDIVQRLGRIESSYTYLEGHSTESDIKIDKLTDGVGDLTKEMAAARATFKTLQWVAGIAGTILVLLWGLIATIVTMAIKHYLGW